MTSSIIYDSSADRIVFINVYNSYANGTLINSATTLTYNYHTGIVENECVNFADDKSFGFMANATWKAANIKYKDQISYSISSSVSITNSKANELSNNLRELAMVSCGAVISVSVNLTMADIGFTSYKPSSEPDTKPEKSNAEKLIDYINAHPDFTNSDGNKGIKKSIDTSVETAIIYNKSTDRIVIICSNDKLLNGTLVKAVTSLTYNYHNGTVEEERIDIANDESFGFKATATWKAASMKKDAVISYSLPMTYKISNSQANTLANQLREITLLTADIVLMQKTSMTLADIGFTNYTYLNPIPFS